MMQARRFITTSALSIILFLALSSAVSAQLDVSAGIAIRDRAVGPNLSVNYSLGSRWRVGMQGQVFQFYQSYVGGFNTNYELFNTRNNYLYVQPTISYKFIRNSKFNSFAGVSPSFRFKLSDNYAPPRLAYIAPGLVIGTEYSIAKRWFAFAQIMGVYEGRINDINGEKILPSGLFTSVTVGVGYRINW